MVYLDKLQTKIDAILAKDIDAIYAQHPYLPKLGNTYTKVQLQTWLNKVVKILTDAQTLTDAQLETYRLSVYNSLTTAQKAVLNDFITGKTIVDITTYSQTVYDKFIILMLINHITTP